MHDVPKLVVNWNQPAIGVVTSTRNVPSRVRVGVTDADDATASVPVISSSSPPLPGDYLPGQRSACENQPTTNFRAKETASSRLVGVANIDHPNQIPYQEPQVLLPATGYDGDKRSKPRVIMFLYYFLEFLFTCLLCENVYGLQYSS